MPRALRSRAGDAAATTPSKPYAAPTAPAADPSDPLSIDYRAHPEHYRVLRGEMNVFKTNPYSAELKVLWRFKDEEAARTSAEALWERFEGFRDKGDFVGMDVTRKFIQMGRTRSLRYALRPGGRKYDPATGKEMKRTGEVADEGKLAGANIFESYLADLEADEVYAKAKEEWVDKYEPKGKAAVKGKATKAARSKGSTA